MTDAVFYQIFPDRFARSERIPRSGLNLESWDSPPTAHGFKGGDLYGVAEHLDYLEDLGINALYLNPIFASASNHRYHTYDYLRVDPLLGGDAAFRELLDGAHARGMRVILDGVFNHASRGFWQFHHTLENGAASPYVDWFHFDPERLHGQRPWGAYSSPADQEAVDQENSLAAIGYRAWWNLPALPKFNTATPAVREFIFGVAEHWIRFGIDGWRLDVPGEIDDDAFWQEFRLRVRRLNPEAYLVGEIWHDARRWLQGDQFDASMNYPVTAACLGFFAGRHLNLDEALRVGGFRGQLERMDARAFADRIEWCRALYSDDVNRVQLNPLDTHDMPRFLTCAGGDPRSLQLALLFLLTYPGAPSILYGDEIGLVGGRDPDCRRSFLWSQADWNSALRDFVRGLIRLRRERQSLRWGKFAKVFAEDQLYAFQRSLDNQITLVALNSGDQDAELHDASNLAREHSWNVLFGSAELISQDPLRIRVRGRSGAVLAPK